MESSFLSGSPEAWDGETFESTGCEDIRILKRHVDELNELFVSGQAQESTEPLSRF